MKQTFKDGVKKLLSNSGAMNFMGSFRPASVVVLRYHSVLENPDTLNRLIGPGIVHSAKAFESHMQLLAKSFTPVTMDDILSFAAGDTKIPRRAVVVTFDDGFADNAEVAAPIMDVCKVKGAFYVTTGSISPQSPPWFFRVRRAFHTTQTPVWISPLDGTEFKLNDPQQRRHAFLQASRHCAVQNLSAQHEWIKDLEELLAIEKTDSDLSHMMTADQIMKLHNTGHIVGSHTVSHPNVAHIEEKDVGIELETSKNALEKIINNPVIHFSYPSPILQPHYNSVTTNILEKLGYKTAVTCTHGVFGQTDNPLVCKRIVVPEKTDDLKWAIESVLAAQ